MLAGVHDELALDGPHPVLLVLWEGLVPSNHECIHIGNTSTRCKDTVAILKSEIKKRFVNPSLNNCKFYPIISRIFFRHSCSMSMKTGAIS